MRSYFCGWYFRCQTGQQTLAIIPSVHKTKKSNFCAIQLITDTESFQVEFPFSAFQKHDDQITIAENRFGKEGIHLDIQTPSLRANGSMRFGSFSPIRYDIMGPFRFVPFMQCRHSVYSMHHSVDGEITVNGTQHQFQNAIGYVEGDRGYSFPKEYVWTQCSFPNGALMLSIADIPLETLRFTGVIGIVYLNGKEYRLATYLGSKAIKITPDEIVVRQGEYFLTVKPKDISGHPLQAPVAGAMSRTIYEHPSCNVNYRFEKKGIPLMEIDAHNAAFEYEY